MHIDVKSDNAFARRVVVRISASQVQSELTRAFKKLGDRARIPGFRPGKVPMTVLEARYGEKVREDVAASLIQSSWTQALNTHKLVPVSRPSVTQQDAIGSGKEFSFTIAFEVRPIIEAATYTGLAVRWPAWEVSDTEIDHAIEARRRGLSRLMPVEGRAVKHGDVAQVSVVAREGETVLLDEPGTLIRTANDPWLPGIEHLVIGLAVDEERSGTAHIGAESRNKELAGRSVEATVKVIAIQEYVVPELDEALAVEMGHASIADLRESVRGQLGKGREEWARNQARASLLQSLIDANPFEVPASMVEQNLQLLQEELKMQQAYAGRDPRSITFNAAQLADLRMRAGFAAKGGLLLESVARQEALAVTDADVEAKIQELAQTRGQNLESMRAFFSGDDALQDLRERIKEEKTLDWLLSVAAVEHIAPAAPAVEVVAPAEAAPAEAAPAEAASTEAAPAEAAPAVEEAPAEEAPKKKRASKAKAEEPAEEPAAAEALEEAPKKKRAAKAKAEEPAAEDAPAAESTEEAPKKKRASKKAAE